MVPIVSYTVLYKKVAKRVDKSSHQSKKSVTMGGNEC